MTNFTREEMELAKQADLVEVASCLGFHPKKIGRFYTLKEMDSIRIYNRSNWYRFSKKKGGSQIDFLTEFAGLSVKDSIFWLLDFIGYKRDADNISDTLIAHTIEKSEKDISREFILPKASLNNTYLYSYLTKERKISKALVDYLIDNELVYESDVYHNVVFLGKDINGEVKFASQRGVFDKDGKSFKRDVSGSDKHYGFNIANVNSNELIVFEAAIDLLSYVDIYADKDSNLLALGMLDDKPLVTFLDEHPQITNITFCLDNDEPGRTATKSLLEKYKTKGYIVKDNPAPANYKDYNEWLVSKVKKTKQIKR